MSDSDMIRMPEVVRMTTMCRAWIYREIQRGRFPAQTKFGTASVWRRGDVAAWLAGVEAHREANLSAYLAARSETRLLRRNEQGNE